MRGQPGSRPRPRAHVRLFCRQFSSPASCSPLPPSCLGDVELWMLKGSSSFRQDFSESCSLWGALGSSCGREGGQGRAAMGASPGTQMSPPRLRWWHWGHRGDRVRPHRGSQSQQRPEPCQPGSPCQPRAHPRGHPALVPSRALFPAPRQSASAGGGHRGWVYCGSQRTAGAGQLPVSPRAVPARSRSTAGSGCAAPGHDGRWPGGCQEGPRCSRCHLERSRGTGTPTGAVTQGQESPSPGQRRPAGAERAALAPPLLDPQKPRGVDPADPSSSSQCCVPGTACRTLGSGGDGGRVRARHRVHPEVHLSAAGRGRPRSLLPGLRLLKAVGRRGTAAMGGERLKGPTLLLRLALRKALRFSLFRVERQEVGRASQPRQHPGASHPPAPAVIRWSCP